MSDQFWKKARSNNALVQQWQRRVSQPLPFVLQEIHQRMIARAQIMRPVEGCVVHQGWLHPANLPDLQNLFPGRALHVLAPAPIGIGPAQKSLLSNTGSAFKAFLARLLPSAAQAPQSGVQVSTVAPGAHLPLPAGSVAMVWSPLWLHGINNPPALLEQWLNVLKPQGAVFFTAFGPDTARELLPLAGELGIDFPDFADMHDLGDVMGKAGFTDPVMESERLTLTYNTVDELLADWRALLGNNLAGRANRLWGKALKQHIHSRLQALRGAETGRIALTLEIVYGHAWKVERKVKSDIATIAVSEIGGRKKANPENN